MSTETQKVAEVTKKPIAPIIIGGVMVIGAHLISERLKAVTELLIAQVQPNITSLVFRDDKLPMAEGETVHGMFMADMLTCHINLERHMDEVREALVSHNPDASFHILYWDTLLVTIIHEFYHGYQYANAPAEEKATILGRENLSDEAQAYARELIEKLVLNNVNLEPPAIADEPMLAFELEGMLELHKANIEGSKDPWLVKQIRLVSEKVAFEDTEGKKYFTYRNFIRATSKIKEDPRWDIQPDLTTTTAVVEVKPPVILENGVILDSLFNPSEDESFDDMVMDHVNDQAGSEEVSNYVIDQDFDSEADAIFMSMMGETGGIVSIHMVGPADSNPVMPVETKTYAAPAYVPPPPPNPVHVAAPVNTSAVYTAPVWVNPGLNGTAAPANMGATWLKPEVLPVVTLTPQQQKLVAEQVFARLFYQLFSKCQFNAASQTSFDHPTGVLESTVRIDDIPGATSLFLSYDCGDQAIAGNYQTLPVTAEGIRGFITKDKRLPGFSVWINRGGVKAQLKMLPQNPNSVFPVGHHMAGQLKKSAQDVRVHGMAIAWVMAETPKGQNSEYLWCYEMAPGGQLVYRWLKDQK